MSAERDPAGFPYVITATQQDGSTRTIELADLLTLLNDSSQVHSTILGWVADAIGSLDRRLSELERRADS
jgi:hypothetical protein